jgi:hypothetical protein
VDVQRLSFLTPNYMQVSGQARTPATLPPGKEPPLPLNRRLGGPESSTGRFEEEKILLPLVFEHRIVQAAAYSLYQLRYRGSLAVQLCFN